MGLVRRYYMNGKGKADKEAEMKASRIILMAAVFVLALSGCTNKDKDKETGDGDTSAPLVDDLGPEDGEEFIFDKGKECKNHAYGLKPGEQKRLEFAYKMPFGSDFSTEWSVTQNQLEDKGLEVQVESYYMDSYSYPVWKLDASEAFSMIEENNGQKPVSTFYQNKSAVVFFDEWGYGVIMKSIGGDFNPEKTGELSEEEIREVVGNDMSMMVGGNFQTYPTYLSRDYDEGQIAVMTLLVTAPKSDKLVFKTDRFRKVVIKGEPKGRMTLEVGRWPKGAYRIMGPDQRRECLEKE